MAISKVNAKALATLVLDDAADYVSQHKKEFADYLTAEKEMSKLEETPPKKRRQSKKSH